VISGNYLDGILVRSHSSGNQIVENFIGTDAGGVNRLPNGRAAVRFKCTEDNTLIGNTIAYSKQGIIWENGN
jgi:hypothetical protein